MKRAKFTTRRWKMSATLRKERLLELLSKTELRETLNSEFIKGVETRRDLLESRKFSLYAWQVPLFLFLTLSLMPTKVSGTIFGVSIESAKTLREVLLIVSSTLGIVALIIQNQLFYLNEMLDVVAIKQSAKNKSLNEFLEIRYGTNFLLVSDYSDDLKGGAFKVITAVIFIAAFVSLFLIIGFLGLAVHVLNLIEVYNHPNLSPGLSKLVMTYVILADVVSVTTIILTVSILPYQTWEDFNKLQKLKDKDEAAYQAVLKEVASTYVKKGRLRRIFSRPKLPRMK